MTSSIPPGPPTWPGPRRLIHQLGLGLGFGVGVELLLGHQMLSHQLLELGPVQGGPAVEPPPLLEKDVVGGRGSSCTVCACDRQW